MSKLAAWLDKNGLNRDQLSRHGWAKPFVSRADLWRFTRRSVPRGVAAGLFVGVFFLIPGIQIIGAAIFCLPIRGNIPVAAGMTFLTNPATTPFLLAAAIWVGNLLGFRADLATLYALKDGGAGWREWLSWAASDAAPAIIAGLFIIGIVSAVIGYVLSVQVWRVWQGRRWHGRSWKLGGDAPR